jgi:hypothetical protein
MIHGFVIIQRLQMNCSGKVITQITKDNTVYTATTVFITRRQAHRLMIFLQTGILQITAFCHLEIIMRLPQQLLSQNIIQRLLTCTLLYDPILLLPISVIFFIVAIIGQTVSISNKTKKLGWLRKVFVAICSTSLLNCKRYRFFLLYQAKLG